MPQIELFHFKVAFLANRLYIRKFHRLLIPSVLLLPYHLALVAPSLKIFIFLELHTLSAFKGLFKPYFGGKINVLANKSESGTSMSIALNKIVFYSLCRFSIHKFGKDQEDLQLFIVDRSVGSDPAGQPGRDSRKLPGLYFIALKKPLSELGKA